MSVVIPCYNYGRFLADAIESALAQTYRPLEVLVVDDGSTDNTAAVAARFPVQMIRQPNRGLSAAGNRGIRAAGGEFVVRLDADDCLARTYVEETVAPLICDPSLHFVYTEMQYFGAETGGYDVEEFDPESLTERNYVHATATMRHTSFAAAGGYRENMTQLRVQDWDLWLSFVERGFPGLLIRKPLLAVRRHGPSMVTIDLRSPHGIRREVEMASRLQDNHPTLFMPQALLRRLRRLPGRLLRREVTPQFALRLTSFYGVMLVRAALSRRGTNARE